MLYFQITVTLPIADNEGNPTTTAHRALCALLGDVYDGYSVRQENGVWRNANGKSFSDRNLVYYTVGSASQAERVIDDIPNICKLAKQQVVMVTQTVVDLKYIAAH